MSLLTFLLVLGSFVVGCFVGFMIQMLVNVSAMRMGKAFFKKRDGKWYPFNPFRPYTAERNLNSFGNTEPKEK